MAYRTTGRTGPAGSTAGRARVLRRRPRRARRAVRPGGRVRRAGGAPGRVSGHSFTALCVTDGVQVDLSRLDRLLDVDDAAGRAVQAGITLHALSAALHQHGRALENLGDVDTQTLAGALATGDPRHRRARSATSRPRWSAAGW